MVLDDRGRIRWRGSGSRDALGEAWDTASNLDELATGAPSLAAWCRDATRAVPARARRAEIPLGRRAGARRETVSLTPVFIGAASDPHWIVRLEAPADASERAWRMMAQRIAHAVKNPLTHMLLTVQRLQTEYRERAPAVASRLDPYADRIQDGVGQLRRLTSSFLKLVDLAEPELRPTDLGQVLAEFATQTRGRLPHDIQLRLEVEGEVPSAPIDREQVHVALDNLVTNAVNALEAGGTITLALSPAPGPGPAPGGEAGDYVQVEVMDTGKGIAPDDRVHIFEPGYSTAEDGSGLGLAIVRKIVADHGGHVSVDSEVGVGSVFTLLFPVAEGARTEEPV
jgi:two-component system nitrogen regulation sensor histidine kinase NtrY